MRDPRDCFLLGVCWKRRFTRENARSSSETNSKRTLLEQSEGVFEHARTFARSRSDARLHSPENNTCGEFPVFQKLQFRVFGRPERRSKVTSVYRKTSNASTSSGFHTERERLNPSLVASHHEYHRVLFLNKNTI